MLKTLVLIDPTYLTTRFDRKVLKLNRRIIVWYFKFEWLRHFLFNWGCYSLWKMIIYCYYFNLFMISIIDYSVRGNSNSESRALPLILIASWNMDLSLNVISYYSYKSRLMESLMDALCFSLISKNNLKNWAISWST